VKIPDLCARSPNGGLHDFTALDALREGHDVYPVSMRLAELRLRRTTAALSACSRSWCVATAPNTAGQAVCSSLARSLVDVLFWSEAGYSVPAVCPVVVVSGGASRPQCRHCSDIAASPTCEGSARAVSWCAGKAAVRSCRLYRSPISMVIWLPVPTLARCARFTAAAPARNGPMIEFGSASSSWGAPLR
jgi:hypothetical protein